MNKFRDLVNKISIFLLNETFIYFVNLISLLCDFVIYILIFFLNFHVKIKVGDHGFNLLFVNPILS